MYLLILVCKSGCRANKLMFLDCPIDHFSAQNVKGLIKTVKIFIKYDELNKINRRIGVLDVLRLK